MSGSPRAPRPRRSAQAFFDRRGRLTVERRGLPRRLGADFGKDAYHFLRTASWLELLAFMAVLWIAANAAFAAVLWIGHARILNAGDGFLDRFWFSVETMATIGYGHLVPADTLAHVVVTIESLVGILITAMATGLFFAKFSTPNAKVLFSEVAAIAPFEGVPCLMFRMANARATAIVEAAVRVTLTREEVLASGDRMRRVYDLPVRRATTPVFALSWTVFHPIDEASPLHGATAESLRAQAANLLVMFTGIDDSLAASVHTRWVYGVDDLRFDVLFVDIMLDDEHGRRYLDFTRFHETRPAAAPAPAAADAGPPAAVSP